MVGLRYLLDNAPKGEGLVEEFSSILELAYNVYHHEKTWSGEESVSFKVAEAVFNLAYFARHHETEQKLVIDDWVRSDPLLNSWHARLLAD